MHLLCIVWLLTFTHIHSCVFPPTSPWSFTFWLSFTIKLTFMSWNGFPATTGPLPFCLPPSLPPFADDAPAASCFGQRQLMNTDIKKRKRSTHTEDEGKLIFANESVQRIRAMRSEWSESGIPPGPDDWWVAGRQHDELLSSRWSNWFCKVSTTDGFQPFEIQNSDNQFFGKTLWRLKLVLVMLWK